MLLWFAGLSWLAVWRIFRSPTLDYRLVVLGALVPLIDLLLGHPSVLHTLLGPVVVFAVVALGTRRRRLASRRWVGVAIGLFLHLVLDGAWADTDLFWWPVSGAELAVLDVPEASWPTLGRVAAAVAGAVTLVGLWVRLGLADAERRTLFLRTGHLDRELA
jgi:membrane-bound metal-dependent hydrolase YbcI (DUF457 family)